MQEDIIGITDENFNKIVEYEYDSWGNIITIKDNNGNIITDESHIGIINPFRYRSYYYDKETKLYYLNSRYYNPEWGRFINADSYLGVSEDILGYNLYIYVSNNPINNSDNTGQFLKKAWNWVKKKANQVKKTITKSVNAVKKVAKKAKESFVFEGEAGLGFKIEGNLLGIKGEAGYNKSVGYNNKKGHYTSTNAGLGIKLGSDTVVGTGVEARRYDNGDSNPMPLLDELLKDPSTIIERTDVFQKSITQNGNVVVDNSHFIGIEFGLYIFGGGKIKIGFNIGG